MDEADYAQAAADQHLAVSFANRAAPIPAAPGGRCAVCDEKVPAPRLATGAGTCIGCQMLIEEGKL